MEKKEVYKKVKVINEGLNESIYLMKAESTGELCVIKTANIESMTSEDKNETFNEVRILKKLHHNNIIAFREIYTCKKGSLCIVTDYADGGNLHEMIQHRKGSLFPEEKILDWFVQILLAIKYCHERGILHRDLKSESIFLTSKNFVKLGNFGVSKILAHAMKKAQTLIGLPYYHSPEIIRGEKYSFPSDI